MHKGRAQGIWGDVSGQHRLALVEGRVPGDHLGGCGMGFGEIIHDGGFAVLKQKQGHTAFSSSDLDPLW